MEDQQEAEIKRLAYITHIHEAAIKDAEIDLMLSDFYKKVCSTAERKGVRLSIINIKDFKITNEVQFG